MEVLLQDESSYHAPKRAPDDQKTSDDNCRIRLQSEASDDSGFEGLENLEPFDFGLDLTDDSHLTLVRKSSHDSGVEADPSPGGETDEQMPDVTLWSVAMQMVFKDKEDKVTVGGSGNVKTERKARAKRNWFRAMRLVTAGARWTPGTSSTSTSCPSRPPSDTCTTHSQRPGPTKKSSCALTRNPSTKGP